MAIKARVFKRRSYGAINKKLAHLMSNLFIKSISRAENVYRSMESRGFDGNFYMVETAEGVKIPANIILPVFILLPVSLKIFELCNFF